MKISVDVSGGNNYVAMGTTQLRSVPYALFAETSNNPGPQGIQGVAGNDGVDGVDGTNGVDGLNGTNGTNGVDGVDGTNGVDGLNGTNGTNGVDGVDGVQGPIGPSGGAQGPAGNDGIDGIDGANGTNGIDGVDGLVGAQGIQGIAGNDGIDGVGIAQTLTISGDTLFISSGNYIILPTSTLLGCTDSTASNYNPLANTDDGSCAFSSLVIGDFHQGGIIFWLDGNGGGLIAAPTDQTTGGSLWGCYGTGIGTNSGIGTGAQNTINIEVGCTTAGIAADICANLTLGGYSDWFLPSKDELNEMYINLHQQSLGSFSSFVHYWSSTENGNNHAWVQSFGSGLNHSAYKNSPDELRAVRAF